MRLRTSLRSEMGIEPVMVRYLYPARPSRTASHSSVWLNCVKTSALALGFAARIAASCAQPTPTCHQPGVQLACNALQRKHITAHLMHTPKPPAVRRL